MRTRATVEDSFRVNLSFIPKLQQQESSIIPMSEQPPTRSAGALASDASLQRWSVAGAVLLVTLVSGLLGESTLRVALTPIGEPAAGSWMWLLGTSVQTVGSSTTALLLAALFFGLSLSGVWFLIALGVRTLRRQL